MIARELANALLARLEAAGVSATGITADSRRVRPGEIFAAWPGAATDGRRFIDAAVERGAAAVLWDDADGFAPGALPVPAFAAPGLRLLAGHLANLIQGEPSRKLWMCGVTGTNGKTTVSQWIARSLSDLGESCGVIGTLGNGFPGRLADALNTTPDALELHRLLADFVAQGARAAAMEVSSIGLDQGRVNGARFNAAIFTNLTRDHLDYHGTMEAYAEAKARLFDLPELGTAILNLDDAFGVTLAQRLAARGAEVVGYSLGAANAGLAGRTLIAEGVHASSTGLGFTLKWAGQRYEMHVRMVAGFNVANLLAVAAALLTRDFAPADILHVLGRLTPPEGRMQLVGGVGEPLVIVDYAHSPDALAKVLDAVRGTATARGGQVCCVFGCGGDRDPGKRPMMGEVARQRADRVIVTSDNPRSEDPLKIIAAVAAGAGPRAESVVDRAQAIRIAIAEAGANDVVVLAGKGHEPYQEVLGVRVPFSDVEQAKTALRAWNTHKRGDAC